MKKILLSISILFLTTNLSYCDVVFEVTTQDSFYTGAPYYDYNKMKFPASKTNPAPSPVSSGNSNDKNETLPEENLQAQNGLFFEDDEYIPKTQKKKWGIFKQKEEDPQKQTRFNPMTNKVEEIPRGYWGTLPSIKEAFRYKEQDMPSDLDIVAIIPEKDGISKDDLKQAPWDDALFLDKIVEKEEPSQYLKDIQKTKFALNNLKKCIEEKSDIQRYIAAVNTIDLYVKNLKIKYENEIEHTKPSYNNIISTVYQAKVLGNLMYDAGFYARYTPVSDGKYSKDNIDFEKQKLLGTVLSAIDSIEKES